MPKYFQGSNLHNLSRQYKGRQAEKQAKVTCPRLYGNSRNRANKQTGCHSPCCQGSEGVKSHLSHPFFFFLQDTFSAKTEKNGRFGDEFLLLAFSFFSTLFHSILFLEVMHSACTHYSSWGLSVFTE